MKTVSAFMKSLSTICFPPRCLCCDTTLAPPASLLFCPDCLDAMDFIKEPFCSCCGRTFAAATGDNHLCGNCLTKPPHFTTARAVAHYHEPLSSAIHAFKYNGRTFGLNSFATLYHQHPHPPNVIPDLILPVPLHRQRLRERGFNQALLLARAFFPAERERIDPELLLRRKQTPPQTGLSGKIRRRNLKDGFTVSSPARLTNKTVLLIDDVYTTGSTANECARTLKRAGAREVHVLTLARVAE